MTRTDGTPMSPLGSACFEMMKARARLQQSRLPERTECPHGRCGPDARKPFRIDFSMTAEEVATGVMREIVCRGAASCIAEARNSPADAWLYDCARNHLVELLVHSEFDADDTILEAAEDVLWDR